MPNTVIAHVSNMVDVSNYLQCAIQAIPYLILNWNLAIYCGDPSQNLTLLKQTYSSGPSIPGNPTEGANFGISCMVGYTWQDLLSVKIMNCSKYGNWFPFYGPCLSMCFSKFVARL